MQFRDDIVEVEHYHLNGTGKRRNQLERLFMAEVNGQQTSAKLRVGEYRRDKD